LATALSPRCDDPKTRHVATGDLGAAAPAPNLVFAPKSDKHHFSNHYAYATGLNLFFALPPQKKNPLTLLKNVAGYTYVAVQNVRHISDARAGSRTVNATHTWSTYRSKGRRRRFRSATAALRKITDHRFFRRRCRRISRTVAVKLPSAAGGRCG